MGICTNNGLQFVLLSRSFHPSLLIRIAVIVSLIDRAECSKTPGTLARHALTPSSVL